MAKNVNDAPKDVAPEADVNPRLAFEADWDNNRDNMRVVTVRQGRLRGNLRPSEMQRGREILKKYGL